MGAAGFSGSSASPMQYEKQEIHTVFLCFSYFPGKQNLSLSALADLIRASLILPISLPESPLSEWKDRRYPQRHLGLSTEHIVEAVVELCRENS